MTNEDIVAIVDSALATELDVHPSNLDVSFDSETGALTYVITSDDIDLVSDAITILVEPDFITRIDVGEEILIDSIEVSDDIIVTIDVIVDASNISDANIAVDMATQSIQQQDDSFEISSQRNRFKKFKIFFLDQVKQISCI